jgi:hypothetical protein
MPKCKDCWDVGEWVDYRNNAGGKPVRCTCPTGRS